MSRKKVAGNASAALKASISKARKPVRGPLESAIAEPDFAAQALQERTKGPRLLQLDALRGLAAVAVVLHHLRSAFEPGPAKWYLLPFFGGESAVVLFFVLSGYVLSLPYWTGKSGPYLPYLVRRLCRVYLPFAGALLLAAVGAWWFGGKTPQLTSQLTPWFGLTWHTPVTWHLLAAQLRMRPTPELNTAFWSLRFEMEMSFVMPALCLLLRKGNAAGMTAVGALAVASVPVMPAALQAHYFYQTLAVLVLFAMGATLAKSGAAVQRWFASGKIWSPLLLAFSILLFWQFSARWENVVSPQIQAHFSPYERTRTELLCGLGAVGIIACALNIERFRRLLMHPALEYLGRISFSLYLVHGTVLFAGLFLFFGRVPLPLLIGSILVMSFAAAHLFCIAVEEPAMQLGRWLSASLRRVASGVRSRLRMDPLSMGHPSNMSEREEIGVTADDRAQPPRAA